MKDQILQMGLQVLNVHDRGVLYCNSDKTFFLSVLEKPVKELIIYYKENSKTVYKSKTLPYDSLIAVDTYLQEVKNQ